MLPTLRAELYMHRHDPEALRRLVGACFLVLRQGCAWVELGRLVPSADAARRRFRRWTRHVVENLSDRLKDFRRMGMRPDKTEASFRAFASLAALMNRRLVLHLVHRA